jgi:haloalkane dehalogenase
MTDKRSPAPASSPRVTTPAGALYVTDHPGAAPAIVMMHGFPDDSRIYDHLAPLLKPYRAVTFDWLGYGHSDRTDTARITSPGHQAELGAVLDGLGIDRVVLVGHDASGPDAINYALRHQHRVARLVLLNTYYGNATSLRFPEMIRLLADQDLEPLADAILADPEQRLWLLLHTARRFGFNGDSLDPEGVGVTSVIPQFFGYADQPDALVAIRAWTRTVHAALAEQDATIASGALAALDVPVMLIFGPRDEYLSPVLAAHLSGLFNNSTVHLADGASHWPQWDQPEVVARLIKGDIS